MLLLLSYELGKVHSKGVMYLNSFLSETGLHLSGLNGVLSSGTSDTFSLVITHIPEDYVASMDALGRDEVSEFIRS